MSKFTDNLKNLFANPEDAYDDDIEEEDEEEEVQEEPVVRTANARPAASASSNASTASAPKASASKAAGVGANANLEMRIIKPTEYEMVREIVDQLLDGRTVILNMEDAKQELVRQVLDYCGGAVQAINGNIKRVGNSTYIIAPDNVAVSGEMAEEAAEKAPKEIF